VRFRSGSAGYRKPALSRQRLITAQNKIEQVTERPKRREKSRGELDRGVTLHFHRVNRGDGENVSEVGKKEEKHQQRWPLSVLGRFSNQDHAERNGDAHKKHG